MGWLGCSNWQYGPTWDSLVGFLGLCMDSITLSGVLAMKIKDEYARGRSPNVACCNWNAKNFQIHLGNTIILLPYSLVLSFIPDGMGLVYTVIAAVSGGLMLAYHYKLTKTPTSEFAWKAYKVTAPYLTIIFVAVALDAAFHIPLF